jgi:hypothetical protein
MFKYLTLTASLFLFCAGSNASGAQLSKDIANIAKAALTKGELETRGGGQVLQSCICVDRVCLWLDQ